MKKRIFLVMGILCSSFSSVFAASMDKEGTPYKDFVPDPLSLSAIPVQYIDHLSQRLQNAVSNDERKLFRQAIVDCITKKAPEHLILDYKSSPKSQEPSVVRQAIIWAELTRSAQSDLLLIYNFDVDLDPEIAYRERIHAAFIGVTVLATDEIKKMGRLTEMNIDILKIVQNKSKLEEYKDIFEDVIYQRALPDVAKDLKVVFDHYWKISDESMKT